MALELVGQVELVEVGVTLELDPEHLGRFTLVPVGAAEHAEIVSAAGRRLSGDRSTASPSRCSCRWRAGRGSRTALQRFRRAAPRRQPRCSNRSPTGTRRKPGPLRHELPSRLRPSGNDRSGPWRSRSRPTRSRRPPVRPPGRRVSAVSRSGRRLGRFASTAGGLTRQAGWLSRWFHFSRTSSFVIFCCNKTMPSMSASGRGGHPGTYTSTGMI